MPRTALPVSGYMADRKSIERAIAREEALLSRLDKVREHALSRINDFKRELASLEATCSESHAPYAARTSQEKVGLFRSLFRGRVDVFPKLWTSSAGEKGYSPACTNDWMSGVCGKTRKPPVRCSECPDRKFLPVTDQVIIDHLQGRQVIGVYPMLPDDTCCFLAADFDKDTWMDDVRAFRETCKSMSIPVAVNCCCVPRAMLGFRGMTDRETTVATVRVASPETVPGLLANVAVTVTAPVVVEEAIAAVSLHSHGMMNFGESPGCY